MTIEAIAAAAVGALAPYVAEAGKAFAKKSGEQLQQSAASLYAGIKRRVSGDPEAESTLASFEREPNATAARTALADTLAEKLRAHVDAAAEIEKQVVELQRLERREITVSGSRAVGIGGDAIGNIIVTGDENTIRPK